MQYKKLIDEFIRSSAEILKENLEGIYLHGSLAFGCFNPDKSDIDLIVVIKDDMSNEDKLKFMEMTVRLNKEAPKKGIEMSIVKLNHCINFIYPTPYELHFSNAHLDWYNGDKIDYINKMNGVDPDLAAHFTVINHKGIKLYGKEIGEVFSEVPKKYYLESIKEDIINARENILNNPVYMILNLTRVLAFIKEDKVLSKLEGGIWGKENLPKEYTPIVVKAINTYKDNEEFYEEKEELIKFAEFMLNKIL